MLRSHRNSFSVAKHSNDINYSTNYSILASRSVRANTDFTLSLTIHDAQNDGVAQVRVSIEDEDNQTGYRVQRNFALNPNITELVSIPVGDVPMNGRYRLMVDGISGIKMQHEQRLHLQTQRHIIFIQTDKATYKPNDCIKFRVLVLDYELKAAPIENNQLKIDISDPCDNLLKKWNGVNTVSGVFSDDFQLSDVPNLGNWSITASVDDQVQTVRINVTEYVLPKFEVGIDSPGTFMPEDEKVHVVVRAKYAHGKPMRGIVVVEIYTGYSRQALVRKKVAINGQETIEFDTEKDLKFDKNSVDITHYEVTAEVTESVTGLSQKCEMDIKVDSNYVISTNPKAYAKLKRGSAANLTISVRKSNGAVPNFDDPSKKEISVMIEQFHDTNEPSTKRKTVHRLNDIGDVVVRVNIAEDVNSFSLQVNYASQETIVGTFQTFANAEIATNTTMDSKHGLLLETKDLKKKYKINKPIDMEVISSHPIPSYTYVVVARGKILESNTITQPIFDDSYESVFVHRFSIHPHFGYAPQATITVYCVSNGSLITSSFMVELYDDFKNFIELNVSQDVAKPGDIVDIKVKSNENAIIGLLGTDKSTLILGGSNDLARGKIWFEFEKAWLIARGNDNDFTAVGLTCFSNLDIKKSIPEDSTIHLVERLRGGGDCRYPGGGRMALPQQTIREFFPETWIWETIDPKNFDGSLILPKKVPDSLTTWILTGFSIDPVNGFALIEAPLKLRVQQQFYISINLPYSVKRDENVTIPCAIFNHSPNDINAEVTLDSEHDEFEFVDAPEEGGKNTKCQKVQFRKKNITVCSEDAAIVHFTIWPKKVGSIALKVSAISSAASDCVIHSLNVECEGVPQFVNKAVFIDLRKRSETESIDLIIDIPKIALQDSERIEITCVGDLLGAAIKNLQQLIRLPCGCGEQIMINFVPNIVILNYLKNTNQLTDAIEAKAKKYMEIGYQRELNYKHKDGSFSAFGRHDRVGSTWLTAFVVRSFQQASEHIHIQNDIVDKALKWLSKKQSTDGRFMEKGSIFDKEMQSGAANGVALTAYVLTAFLVNESSKIAYKTTIRKAIDHIIISLTNCSDAYALAVCAYALQLAGHEFKKKAFDRLNGLAMTTRAHKWWEKTTRLNKHSAKKSKTLNIEITAYALLTLLQNEEDDSDILPIVKWLLNQRNGQGGFEGTQDTIIGIEALATFAFQTANQNAVNIGIKTSNGDKFTFDIDKDNSLVLQSQKLEPNTKWLSVNATGKGCSLFELAYRYNINAPDAQPAFLLKPNGMLLDEDHMSVSITVGYQSSTGQNQQSNMVILEVSLPSGFTVSIENLDSLKKTIPLIKRTETKNGDTMAIIYFDHLTSKTVFLKVDGFRKYVVTEQKPTPIIIYDYYDNAHSAREFYSLERNFME